MALLPMDFDETGFEDVNFGDFFDKSSKDPQITDVTGTVKKMRGGKLYVVSIMITVASESGEAGASGYSIGKFKKNVSPRVIVPLVSDTQGTPRGSLYSNPSTMYTRIYGNTYTGNSYAYFTCVEIV